MGDTSGLTGRKNHRRYLRRPAAMAARVPAKTDHKGGSFQPPIWRATSQQNIVAAGLADKCEVQLAYAIGVADTSPCSSTKNTERRWPWSQLGDSSCGISR